MHLYGAIILTHDNKTRPVPLVATWDLSPIAFHLQQATQAQIMADAKELAEQTSYQDHAQLDRPQYKLLSSGGTEEDGLCGIIVADQAYPSNAALSVLGQMLEGMVVRVPKARYQPRISELAALSPVDFAPVWSTSDARTGRPRAGSRPQGGLLGIDEPVLVAAVELPEMQEYLERYQNVRVAQRLAERQPEARKAGVQTLDPSLDSSPNKKRSFLGMGRKKRSPQSERAAAGLNIRTISRGTPEVLSKDFPSKTDSLPSTSSRASDGEKFAVLSPGMLRGHHSTTNAGHYSPGTVEDPSLAPSPSQGEFEHSVSRKSTIETLRNENTVIDGRSTPVATAASPRRSTVSGALSEPARSAEPNVSLSVEATAPRFRSATVTIGTEPPVPRPAGSALLNRSPRHGSTSRSHRTASLAGSEADEEDRHAAVQASLNSVRSLSRSTASIHSTDEYADETDTDVDLPSDARTPSPLASFSAVRAALALSPTADAKRANRIREISTWNPNPEEVIAPMIVEKRVDFLPNLAMELSQPAEHNKVSDKIIPRIQAPFKTPKMQLKGRRHHTVQPHVPITPQEKQMTLSIPSAGSTSAPSPDFRATVPLRASLGQHEDRHHMARSNSALTSSPPKVDPSYLMAAQPKLHVSHSVGTTGGLRLLPNRRRALTSTGPGDQDEGCVVM